MGETLCNEPAAFYFTWVTGKGGYICHAHTEKLQAIAKTLGCHVELEPAHEDARCEQRVENPR